MLARAVIGSFAAFAILVGAALIPTGASAQRGSHGGGFHGGGFHGGGFHGGGFHGGGLGTFHGGAVHFGGGHFGGFRGSRLGRFGFSSGGVYSWGFYPPYGYDYDEPSCGFVRVKSHRDKRAYWRWVLQCY